VDTFISLTNDNGTVFAFNATLKVINPGASKVTINHADSCGFKLDVEYHGSQSWESVYPNGCFQAITPEEFSPGTTTTYAEGGITFNKVLTAPPDGDYTLKLVNHGEVDASKVDNLDFTISNGEITGQAPIESRVSFWSEGLLIALIGLSIIPKLVRKSPLKLNNHYQN
jgi:hypothetical protein